MEMSTFQSNLIESLLSMWKNITQFLPNLLFAIVIFVVGYFIASFVRKVASKALAKIGINQMSDRMKLTESLRGMGIKSSLADLIGKILFYLLMLGVLITASDVLKMEKLSQAIEGFINYIPNIFGAGFILFLTQMAGLFIREAIEATSEHLNFDYGKAVSRAVYALIFVIGLVLAFGQLQIETELLSNVIQILLLAAGASIGISLGLGTKTVSSQIVSGVYVREGFENGDEISLDDISGTVVDVGSVTTRVQKANGEIVYVPNNKIIENVVHCKKRS